ncbi:MAG TPA: alpha/beta hydrolase [Candidatus Saccharimonadales bacterium]|nr:alpha/beta hydrolase [Candidatus Saccharimonadales bacterium]
MSGKTTKQAEKTKAVQANHKAFYRRKGFLWPVGIVVGLVAVTALSFKLSPFPGAILIRTVFNKNGQQTLAALEKYTPSTPIDVLSNQRYQQGNKNALLDVYIPQSAKQANQALPVVIWTHGGAWVSGDKTDSGPYYKLIAAQGYVVVSVNYTLAPYKKYPAQINELNQAYGFVAANAARYHLNPGKIFLAGDSAGSQLSSQMAALITNPQYADEVGVHMSLKPSQLAGTILFCGIYKLAGLTEADPKMPRILRWGDDEVVRAYSGTRTKSGPLITQMSPYYYVTKDFPATFISGGNADPLTNQQSKPLAEKLTGLNVPVTTLFYPANHTPSLPHEYQFTLDNADGQQALQRVLGFLKERT